MNAPLSGPGLGLPLPANLYPSELNNAPYDFATNKVCLAPGEKSSFRPAIGSSAWAAIWCSVPGPGHQSVGVRFRAPRTIGAFSSSKATALTSASPI